ncbi:MAG: hypothetical protein HOV80_38505 [Polyangiaceae bacterium]|nr:hypothetical protein [Polyangiaceae bacterium]
MTSRSKLTSLLVLVLSAGSLAFGGCGTSASDGDDEDGGDKKGDKGGDEAERAPFFLPTGEADNTAAPSVEVDADGRIHTVFPAFAGGRAYYATCASDCKGYDDVQVVRFDTDSTVANAMLALDADGRPRALLSTFNKVYYASCDADCGEQASWTMTELFDHRSDREVSGEALALDPNGNPAFLMHTYVAYLGIGQKTPETYYVKCEGDCHDPAAWSQTKIADQIWETSTLRFDDAGRAHVATVAHVVNEQNSTILTGAYVLCESGCENPDNWIGAGLEPAYQNLYEAVTIDPEISMDLTSAGGPRIAVIGQDENMQRRVVYFACDESCTADGAFQGIVLSSGDEIGAGLDIALDSKDQPRIAYTYDYNIGLLFCDGDGCTGDNAPWDVSKVELGGEMEPDDIFLEWNCNVAAWFLHSPSVAIGPSDMPRVGYQARDISGGWENPNEDKPDCEAGTDMTWSRLALMGEI